VFSNDLAVEAYVSFAKGTNITIKDFVEFKSGYASNGREYMVGKVKLEKLRDWYALDGVGIVLAAGDAAIGKQTESQKVHAVV
jgi:hypothetical protein